MADDDDARTGTDDAGTDSPPQGDATDWKAEARKWEKRAKQAQQDAAKNADAAKRLQEAEDADKSELDKARELLAAAEQRASDAEGKALRAEIASTKGLSAAQAKRLHGTTQEELEADADELLAAFGSPDAAKTSDADTSTRRPREALQPGASTATEPEKSPAELADAVIAGTRGY